MPRVKPEPSKAPAFLLYLHPCVDNTRKHVWRNLHNKAPMGVVNYEIFFTFVLSRKRQTYRKCFRTCPNLKMWQFSIAKDNEQHSFLVSIWQGALLCTYPISIRCGVLYLRLFCYGFATTFRLINEIGSTLSFCY